MRATFILWTFAWLGLLTACAGYSTGSLAPGQSRADVLAQMGAPSLELAETQGTTLVFARGPYGRHTYFVTLDATGRLLRTEQRLSEHYFAQVRPGLQVQEVLALIGPSRERVTLGRGRGEVWSYRYENPFCQWFRVEFSSEKIVRGSGYSADPACEDKRAFPWLNP